MDYNVRIDGKDSTFSDFINDSSLYKSTFMKYAAKTDLFFAGHFYATGALIYSQEKT